MLVQVRVRELQVRRDGVLPGVDGALEAEQLVRGGRGVRDQPVVEGVGGEVEGGLRDEARVDGGGGDVGGEGGGGGG